MLQSVELLLRFLPESVEKFVMIPAGSRIGPRMEATGARIVVSNLQELTVDRGQPLRTWTSFRVFRREMMPWLTAKTVLLTNNIASELLCGFASPWPAVPRIFINRGNMYGGASAWALRNSLRGCAVCVATSSYQREVLTKSLGVDSKRIRIIPNAVEYQLLKSAGSQRPQWREGQRCHIAVIGYPSPGKNQELLIRSIRLLRDQGENVAGVIIGSAGCDSDSLYLNHLRELVEQLELRQDIYFQPFVEDKSILFSGIDILASTSLREGFGRTIIEAMAARIPVVAMCAGGPETIIDDGTTGILVAKNDPRDFASALRGVLQNESLRNRMVENASRVCEATYDGSVISRSYLSLFRECLSASI